MEGLRDHLARATQAHGHRAVELEFRIGHRLPPRQFVSNVGAPAFARLRAALEAAGPFEDVHTVDDVFPGAGGSALKMVAQPRLPPFWMTKTKAGQAEFRVADPYVARASVSVEATVPPPDAPPPGKPFRRVKARRRFLRGGWAVDTTAVTSTADLDADTTYEVEVELVDHGMFFEKTFERVLEEGARVTQEMASLLTGLTGGPGS